jgi:hypothetical protein
MRASPYFEPGIARPRLAQRAVLDGWVKSICVGIGQLPNTFGSAATGSLSIAWRGATCDQPSAAG